MSLHAFVYPHRGVLPDEEEMKTFDSPALTPQEKSVHEHVLPVAEFRDEPEWEAGELEEDSPYPEVRSAVSNTGTCMRCLDKCTGLTARCRRSR